MGRSKRPIGAANGVRLSPGAQLGAVDLGIKPTSIELDESRIRVRAYERFMERGGGEGSAESDWLDAERELRERSWNGTT